MLRGNRNGYTGQGIQWGRLTRGRGHDPPVVPAVRGLAMTSSVLGGRGEQENGAYNQHREYCRDALRHKLL